ncbi:MAG: serine protease [Gammaproteobacteria bacterium]|jgi:S1-C subfamily serine protease
MPRLPIPGKRNDLTARWRWIAAAALACPLLASPAAGQILSIAPGEPVRGEVIISDDPESASFVTFSFEAPNDVLAISIELEAVADLDLYFDSEYIDDYQDVLAASTGFAGEERLKIDLSSNPDMIADEYFVDVTYGRIDPPVNARGERLRRVPFTLTVDTFSQRVDAELEPDAVFSDRMDPQGGGPFRSFAIDVPRGASALRVDLASDATDLDLRIQHRDPMRTTREADMAAVSWAGHETIVVPSDSGTLRPGRYYIDVFDQAWLDWPADFRLVASFSDRPPAGLIDLPQLTTAEGLDGAVNATVEILHADGGGTGVLLSEAGYILTNFHVVEQVIEGGTWTSARPLIGLTVEPSEGSRVRLLASIVAHDRERDIALLKADADLYGTALPAGYRFPSMKLGDPEALVLGDSLFVLGYPDAGSLGTRVSITATRGIVSGFERRGNTLLVKTDADIASGNSGGPVLNERYELIGIATEAISEEFGNSQIGYIWPLWLVPDDWWMMAGVD